MGFQTSIRDSVRQVLRLFGCDIVRAVENTNLTWLGLRNGDFDFVIDVGANEGQFAKLALLLYPRAEIHCFEPLVGAFTQLVSFAKEHGQARVFCHHVALGDAEGELEFIVHEDHSTSSSFLEVTKLTQDFCPSVARTVTSNVQVKTLDTALDSIVFNGKTSLLKCDVQGFEDRVLRGAKRTLTMIDAAIIEVNFAELYQGQARFVEIVSLLDEAGLRFAGNIGQVYANDSSVLWADCVFVRRNSSQHNL